MGAVGSPLDWIGADLVPGRFYEGEDVPRRIAPFVAAGVLPFLLLPLADASFSDPSVVVAAALVPVLVLLAVFVPWPRLPTWMQALPPLGYFAVVALLRAASPEAATTFDVLATVPIVWFSLYGTRVQLIVAVAGLAATLALPVFLVGGPHYESGQLASAGAGVILGSCLGLAVQSLLQALRRISRESRAILHGVQEAFISIDEEGVVTEWNPQAERTFGWERSEVIGRRLTETIISPADRKAHETGIKRFLATGVGPILDRRIEMTAVNRRGEPIPVELTISAIRMGSRWTFNALLHDIGERKRAEAAVLDAEERFRRAFEDIRTGMAIIGPDGRLIRVNQALSEITGYPISELTGMRFDELCHPEDVACLLEALREINEGERDGYRAEQRYMHSSGRVVWIALNLSPIHDDEGQMIHMIGQLVDMTERKETEVKLTHQALHDPLTGLPNRVLFADRVNMSLARRHTSRLAVVYLDLDNFKPINDTLGHAAGDRVLIEVARRLQRLLREGDTLARLGGDEFAILCEEVDQDKVRVLAERILDALSIPFEVDGREFSLAASIGIAVHSRAGRPADPEEVLRDADHAMYSAKATGKSRYAVFEGWMNSRDIDPSGLERELTAAIASGELTIHYQPEIDLGSGAVTGAEALVRWEHPERGLLEPAEFMLVANASGLITEIDGFVLRQACQQAARWRAEIADDDEFTISVNLARETLADRELSSRIAEALADAGLEPSALCLELPEHALMDREVATIPDIESLGVRLLIDDFGIATASLNTIKRLPHLSGIKIDPSFIAGLGHSPEDSAGVAAIIGLAHGLKLTATAGGVETPGQMEELRALGCDRAQGFYVARPQPAAAFSGLPSSARYAELLG